MKRSAPVTPVLSALRAQQKSPVFVSTRRYDTVDALRGLAMVWMTIFHFCFDLSHFGLWSQNFRLDPFWTNQRTVIVSLFLFCAGLGQAIALHQGQGWLRFGRRWARLAVAFALTLVARLAGRRAAIGGIARGRFTIVHGVGPPPSAAARPAV